MITYCQALRHLCDEIFESAYRVKKPDSIYSRDHNGDAVHYMCDFFDSVVKAKKELEGITHYTGQTQDGCKLALEFLIVKALEEAVRRAPHVVAPYYETVLGICGTFKPKGAETLLQQWRQVPGHGTIIPLKLDSVLSEYYCPARR